MIKKRRKSICDDIEINICDITELWLTENENRNVELNELIITINSSDLNNLTLSIALYWYCKISAIWLIKKQIRDVELK